MEYPTQTRIIMYLKSSGKASLEQLSQELDISKMAVLKHLRRLEERGLVERRAVKTKVGRPYYAFSYTDAAKADLQTSDGIMLNALLDHLKNSGNEELVEDFLRKRYESYRMRYETELFPVDGDGKIKKLLNLREKEDYMPELHKLSQTKYELLERNCPIFKIAAKYPVACSLEENLFSNVLEMDVESSHRQVDGSGICRFLIRKSDTMR